MWQRVRRTDLATRMIVASGLLALIIGADFAVVLVMSNDVRDSARLATHARQELTRADRLEKLVIDLETGQRANAESHGELAASRARVVAAADDARRRIERDLHDGTATAARSP